MRPDIRVYNNPLLLDFIKVSLKIPKDEIDQLEAFTGETFDVDRAAIGGFTAPGPKWVIKLDDEPIVVGGYVPERPGVWRDFMMTTPEAWSEHWFTVTRVCQRIMRAMFASGQAHRLECISLLSRTDAHRWYKSLGMRREAVLEKYCANGADAVSFVRIHHGNG